MVRTQFIDTDYLKDNTSIEYNVDDSKINPTIFAAQDMHIAHVLGSDFYVHLQQAAAGGTLTSDEETLIRDYIQVPVAHWTHYMLVNQLRSKLTNKSLSQENSQYSLAAERQDAQDLKSEIRDLAEFYTQRLIKYLCDYSELFELYENPTDKENLRRNPKTYFTGVFIPNRRSCRRDEQYRNK